MSEKLIFNSIVQPRLAKFDENGNSSSGGGLSRRSFIKRAGGATAATFIAWQGLSSIARAEGGNGSGSGSAKKGILIFIDREIPVAVGAQKKIVTAANSAEAIQKAMEAWHNAAGVGNNKHIETKSDNPAYYKAHTLKEYNPGGTSSKPHYPGAIGGISFIPVQKNNGKWEVTITRNPANALLIIRRHYNKFVGW